MEMPSLCQVVTTDLGEAGDADVLDVADAQDFRQ